ncbi:ATP-dependent acyl-CoA ligase [Acidimangrovimonas sediminis]|uniref:ATP-dependent acyl-CoA ligase n=1 Tax=Acidimangrovimonas sediminis TaxID=2056283 RepID=UPI000C80E69E|nr:ATP-dependent acyl-CoA ligase [Acidimangrovimonas sediminis]
MTDPRVLPDLLAERAESCGEAELVVFEGDNGAESWSYAETAARAAARAGALAEAGVGRGDRVALMLTNRPELLEVILGCLWLGAVAVPVNVASRGVQLQHILSNCGARLMVIEAGLAECLSTLEMDALAVERIWMLDIGAGHPLAVPFPPPGDATTPAKLTAGDTAAIVYTSGTTGPSKGVCCPHAQIWWWGKNTADILGLTEGERLYTVLPLFHVNALNTFYQALITRSTVIFGRRFSASGFWPAVARHRATVTYLLGAMVPILLSRPESPADRDHWVRLALGPGVPQRFHQPFAERFGFALIEGYGSTETNFVIAATPETTGDGTMGRVRPGFSARVVDDHDEQVPPGTAGELILRADEPFAFASGYFGMAEKTVEAWRNLWFHTGDRVVQEPSGAFRFVDRMKDAIRRRGENISSFEVEQVLLSHPGIGSVAAFPVRSEMAEDEVMVAVIAAPGVVLDPVELIDFCRPRLPYFAIPRYIETVEALPVTENGKVRKYVLTERGVTQATWDREAAGIPVR